MEIDEGTPLGRLAHLGYERGRYLVETPFAAWVDVDAVTHCDGDAAPPPVFSSAVRPFF